MSFCIGHRPIVGIAGKEFRTENLDMPNGSVNGSKAISDSVQLGESTGSLACQLAVFLLRHSY